jgi:hypothetical protein
MNELEKLLRDVSGLREPHRETNIFSIGGQGYYENPTSDLLAFFLDPEREHGLGDLMLSCLVELLLHSPPLLKLENRAQREYPTQGHNRIDILLDGSGWVIAIENKVRHGPVNPFAEYRKTVQENFAEKQHYFVILAPYDPRVEGWSWIDYRLLLARVREKLGARLVTSGISKWGIFLREFLINIEDQLERPMDNQEFKFVQDRYADVRKVTDLHEAYIKRLKEEVTRAGADVLGANPAYVGRYDWGVDGIALQLYPKAGREHNSTFLVIPDGTIRIQFYVQTDATLPNNAKRDVFTNDGMFRYMGDEKGGRLWLFCRDEDKHNLDGALSTLRASLSVLQNNTQ